MQVTPTHVIAYPQGLYSNLVCSFRQHTRLWHLQDVPSACGRCWCSCFTAWVVQFVLSSLRWFVLLPLLQVFSPSSDTFHSFSTTHLPFSSWFDAPNASVSPPRSSRLPSLVGILHLFTSTVCWLVLMCFAGFSTRPHCPWHILTPDYSFSIPLCLFEPERSSSAPTVFIQAHSLVLHLHHVYPSANACPRLPPHPFECAHLSFTSTMSIWARTLIIGCHRVHLSIIAHPSPLLCPFKCESSSLAITQAQPLVLHLHCVFSSTNTHPWLPPRPFERSPLPPPCPFECERSSFASAVSIRAQTLVLSCHHISLSTRSCPSPPPCLFEHEHSSSVPTVFTWASSLVLSYNHPMQWIPR